ncbi:hypothetical protein K438DRAFT_1872346 [Mycena galopus ATCC 62051]|nr:hypothetical protein K438DRAFT_1872346 [Mycena galopus ATCC 62051]
MVLDLEADRPLPSIVISSQVANGTNVDAGWVIGMRPFHVIPLQRRPRELRAGVSSRHWHRRRELLAY